MKHGNKHIAILKQLSTMPRKIVSSYDTDNVCEFVLHDLCNEDCFNVPKAAYFIDNPDFDTFKGVCGFNKQELFLEAQNIWEVPDRFTSHMQEAPFNKKVRQLEKNSPRRGCVCDGDTVQMIASELELKDPSFYCWHLKHDNHGMFLYEKNGMDDWDLEDLENACHLLGLCPVF